jgi:hypothetical protein
MSYHLYAGDIVDTVDGTKIENCREALAVFRRRYSKRLDTRAYVEVEAQTFLGSRRFDGILEQPNGNQIRFDPARIADKIIDPTLVPLVATFCDQMFALDRAYVKSRPNEFLDSNGIRWRRV